MKILVKKIGIPSCTLDVDGTHDKIIEIKGWFNSKSITTQKAPNSLRKKDVLSSLSHSESRITYDNMPINRNNNFHSFGFDIFFLDPEMVERTFGIANFSLQQYIGEVSFEKTDDASFHIFIRDVCTDLEIDYHFELSDFDNPDYMELFWLAKNLSCECHECLEFGYFLFNYSNVNNSFSIKPMLTEVLSSAMCIRLTPEQISRNTSLQRFLLSALFGSLKVSINNQICCETVIFEHFISFLQNKFDSEFVVYENGDVILYRFLIEPRLYPDILYDKNTGVLYYPNIIDGSDKDPIQFDFLSLSCLSDLSDNGLKSRVNSIASLLQGNIYLVKKDFFTIGNNIKKIFLHLRLTEAIQLNTGKTLLIKNIGFFFKGESEQFVFSIKNPLSDSITDPEISEMSELSEAYKTFHDKILTAVSKLLAIYADSTENPNNQQYLSKVTALKKIALEHLTAKVADDLQFSGFDEASVKEFIKAVLPSLVSNIQNIDDFNLILDNLFLCVKELFPNLVDQLSDLKIIQTATTVDSNTTYTYKCSCPPLIAEDAAIAVPPNPSFMLRDQQIFSLDNMFNKVKNNEVQVSVIQQKPFELSKTISTDQLSVLSFAQRKTALEIQKAERFSAFGKQPLLTLSKSDAKEIFTARFKDSENKSYSLYTDVTEDINYLSLYSVKQMNENESKKDFKVICEEMKEKLNTASKREHLAYIDPYGVLVHAASSVNIDEILDFIIFKRKASEGDDAGNTLCYEINEDNGDLLFIVRTTNQGDFVHGGENDLQDEEYKKFHGITITQEQLAIYLLKQITPDSQNIDNDLNAFFVAFGGFFETLIFKAQPVNDIGKSRKTIIAPIKLIDVIKNQTIFNDLKNTDGDVLQKSSVLNKLFSDILSKNHKDINKLLLWQINKFKDLFFNTLLVDGFDYMLDSEPASIAHQQGLFPHFIKYFPELFLQNGSFEKVFLSNFEKNECFSQEKRRGLLIFIKKYPAFWIQLKSMPFYLMYKAFGERVFFEASSKGICVGRLDEIACFSLPIKNCPAKWFKDLSGTFAPDASFGTKMFIKHKDTVLLPGNFNLQITAGNLQVGDISDLEQIQEMQRSFVNSTCFLQPSSLSSSANISKSFIDIIQKEQISFLAEFKQFSNAITEENLTLLFEKMLKIGIVSSAESFVNSENLNVVEDTSLDDKFDIENKIAKCVIKALNGFILTQAPQIFVLYVEHFFRKDIESIDTNLLTVEQKEKLCKDIFIDKYQVNQTQTDINITLEKNNNSLMMKFFEEEYYAKVLLPLIDIAKFVVHVFVNRNTYLNANNNVRQEQLLEFVNKFDKKHFISESVHLLVGKIDDKCLQALANSDNGRSSSKIKTLLEQFFDPLFLKKLIPSIRLTCQDIQNRSKMIVLGRVIEIIFASCDTYFCALDFNNLQYEQFDDVNSEFAKAKAEYHKWNTARLILLSHCHNTSTELYESYKKATAFSEQKATYFNYIYFYLFENSQLINDYIKNGLLDFNELKQIIKSKQLIKEDNSKDNSILELYKEESFTKTIEDDILSRSQVGVFIFAGQNTSGVTSQAQHFSKLEYKSTANTRNRKIIEIQYLKENTITRALTEGLSSYFYVHDSNQEEKINFATHCYLLDKSLNICCVDPLFTFGQGYKRASTVWIARRLPQSELRKEDSTVFNISLQDLYAEFRNAIRNWSEDKVSKPTDKEFYADVAKHYAGLLRYDAVYYLLNKREDFQTEIARDRCFTNNACENVFQSFIDIATILFTEFSTSVLNSAKMSGCVQYLRCFLDDLEPIVSAYRIESNVTRKANLLDNLRSRIEFLLTGRLLDNYSGAWLLAERDFKDLMALFRDYAKQNIASYLSLKDLLAMWPRCLQDHIVVQSYFLQDRNLFLPFLEEYANDEISSKLLIFVKKNPLIMSALLAIWPGCLQDHIVLQSCFLQNRSLFLPFLEEYANDEASGKLLVFIKQNPAIFVELMPFHIMLKAYTNKVCIVDNRVVFGRNLGEDPNYQNEYLLPIEQCPANWFQPIDPNNTTRNVLFIKHEEKVVFAEGFSFEVSTATDTPRLLLVPEIHSLSDIYSLQNKLVQLPCFHNFVHNNTKISFFDIIKKHNVSCLFSLENESVFLYACSENNTSAISKLPYVYFLRTLGDIVSQSKLLLENSSVKNALDTFGDDFDAKQMFVSNYKKQIAVLVNYVHFYFRRCIEELPDCDNDTKKQIQDLIYLHKMPERSERGWREGCEVNPLSLIWLFFEENKQEIHRLTCQEIQNKARNIVERCHQQLLVEKHKEEQSNIENLSIAQSPFSTWNARRLSLLASCEKDSLTLESHKNGV